MIIPLLITTFTTVFLAELGDKTQLATIALSGSSQRPLAVFIGSSSALVLASVLGVGAGGVMATMIPSNVLKILASIGFVSIGIKLMWPLITQTVDLSVNLIIKRNKDS